MTDEIQKNKALKDNWFLLSVDRTLDTLDALLTRMTSGRFIATLLVVWTYCRMVEVCGKLVALKILSAETFLAVLAGVAGLVTMMVKDLFASGNAKDNKGGEKIKGEATNEKTISGSGNGVGAGDPGKS